MALETTTNSDEVPEFPVRRIVAAAVPQLALPIPKGIWYLLPPAARARRGAHVAASVPLPRRSPRMAAHVAGDELLRAAVTLGQMRGALGSHAAVSSEMRRALTLFEERGWLTDPRSYHREPLLSDARPKLHAKSGGWELMSFLSQFAPDPAEPGAQRWNSYVENRLASAYVLRRPGPRPWVVAVHGMLMGRPGDRRIFRAEYLHHELGLNVAMPILPLHGSRRVNVRPRPALPTPDTMDDIHGLAQAALDVRTVLAWIRGQAPSGIGLMGMSLGGYVTSLVAGLEPALDCVIAGIPAVDFPSAIAAHTPQTVRRTAWYRTQVEHARTLHRVVSPLEFSPATPVDRRFIYAGTADRVLDPIAHSSVLWEHWGRPRIFWFDGGHVSHVRGDDVRKFTDEALHSTGLAV